MFRRTMQRAMSLVTVVTMLIGIVAVAPKNADAAAGTTYYVDNVNGNDSANGTSTGTPWKTLTKVNATTFAPGDKILFKSGGSWQGQLWPKGSGVNGSPIVIDMYGTGNKPLITGVTSELQTVFLKNQEYWEISNLEITNPSSEPFTRDWKGARGERRGVYILNEESGILNHIYIKNLNIHDVDGVYTTRAGGIIFDSVGSYVPSAFNDVLIDGNTLTDVDAYGIYVGSNCILRYGMSDLWEWVPKPYGPWTPTTNLKISNNTIVRPATGGIAWNVTDGAIIERNTVQEATYLATNASIWWAYADNNVVQFNESFGSHHGEMDGEGFDVDAGNIGSLIQYNYSHDNAGGFMLFVNDTYYTTNTIVRYNISQNDKNHIFRYSGSIDTVYNYNNTVYVGAASGNPVMSDYFTKSSGAPKNIKNYNNVYYSVGDRGWNLTGQTFDSNAYFGGNTLVSSDAHKITANPKLVNPGSGGVGMNTVDGYKLQPDSPLIGAGVPIADNGGRDYFGNTLYNGDPDIGAYEYQGTVPPATGKTPIVFVPAPITPMPEQPKPAPGNLAPLATVSTTVATLNNGSTQSMTDSNYSNAWSSVDEGVTFPNYITLDFGTKAVTANNLKIVTRFGTGQGITKLDLEAYNGTAWAPIKTGVQWVWQHSDVTNETQSLDFNFTTAKKFRLKINGANLKWGNFAINEIELYYQAAVDQAAAKAVRDAIALLPAPSEITLADEAAVQAARTGYNALTDVQKALVGDTARLTDAEAAIAALKEQTNNLSTRLSGPDIVQVNQPFQVRVTLQNVKESVYAQDITLAYDPQVFAFITAKSAIDGVELITTAHDTPGQVRFIAASQGAGHAIQGNAQVLELTLKAIHPSTAPGKILLTKASLGHAQGQESLAAPSSLSIQIKSESGASPDLNHDGKVSIGDIALAAVNYGKTSADADWNLVKHMDLNGDDKINILDLSIVASKIV